MGRSDISATAALVVVLGFAVACASESPTFDDNLGKMFQDAVTQAAIGEEVHLVDRWFAILQSEVGFRGLTQPVTVDRLAAIATI